MRANDPRRHIAVDEEKHFVCEDPINIKHLLLPLNVLINDWIKQCMSQRFADWYAEQIWADLEKGSELENTEVKMTLAVMKNFMLDYCTKN